MKKIKNGFTLAEVLITIGIIGIVAALTLPGLIAEYKTKEYTVRLKKFYNTMQTAIQLSEIDNGSAKYWEYPEQTSESCKNWWNKYFAPYIKSVTKTENMSDGKSYRVYFADGTSVSFSSSGGMDFYYYVHSKRMRQLGRDYFAFIMRKDTGKFSPYDWGDSVLITQENMNNREKLKEACAKYSWKGWMYCTQLLYVDGWEFKEDYPYKYKSWE